ncbi:NKAP domain containing 1 [Lates calcarifer]|uniref:NKAP domain containing 1 n=1 Tax=Lates calcarifer TaxID=8187 RepID=A0A4W6G464_LATCA|nr:NKAP domain containing 1 [Lates calcarifer]
MSKQPMGKTLLRNVIRHTDAHNKIQEEMEMWKMRGWEIQMSHHKHPSETECVRGRMHCDRVPDQGRDLSRSRERVSEHDDREARYWTRKLYEFEASDPDRWGHSGFKELYPEEFESASEKKKIGHHKMKKSKPDTEASLSKRSKKSSRKKKKKKKKKDEGEKQKKAKSSSSDDSSDASSAAKDKQRRKRTKSRHKDKKSVKTRGRDDDSNSEDSDDEGERERWIHSRKKRKQDSHRDSDLGPNSKKKRRKNKKAAVEESSDDSSAD